MLETDTATRETALVTMEPKVIKVDVLFVNFFGMRYYPIPKLLEQDEVIVDMKDLESGRFNINRFRYSSRKVVFSEKHCWYLCQLRKLLIANPGKKLKVTHWKITSGDVDAFKLAGKFYYHVVHIGGPAAFETFYGNPGRKVEISLTTKECDGSEADAFIEDFRRKERAARAANPRFTMLDFAEATARMRACQKDFCNDCGNFGSDELLEDHNRCHCSIRSHLYAVKNEKSTSKYYGDGRLRFSAPISKMLSIYNKN